MKDKILENLIKKEAKRQKETIDLIASENFSSKDVLEALGSVLTNKYAEGYPRKRYYAGNEIVDQVEILAQERARKVFQLSKDWHINVQPYSGSPANLAVYYALIDQGDKIMGLSLEMGGHLTHGQKVSITGKFWKQIAYGVDKKTELLDYDEILKIAKKEKPKIIIAGATAYPRTINFKKFKEIASAVGAYLMVDMSHIAGLIAGKVHPSPFEYADVVTTTTHKTLRGPRGAIIFCKKELAEKIDKAIFPGLQGGPHLNQIAAIAASLKEATEPNFKQYAKQIIKNAQCLSEKLKALNFRIISGGTDNHLILVDLANSGVSGRQAQSELEKAGIIINKNTIPYDTRPPFDPSGIRLGTPAVTSRGMKEKEMEKIAELIHKTLIKKESYKAIRNEVAKLCKKFPALK